MTSIHLRPITPADESFLARLYASTREQELALTNWSDEQKAMFCRMQFNAQTTDYQRNYPDASFDIIERDGVAAGIVVDRALRRAMFTGRGSAAIFCHRAAERSIHPLN